MTTRLVLTPGENKIALTVNNAAKKYNLSISPTVNLASLYPVSVEKTITYSELLAGAVTIITANTNYRIVEVVVLVTSAFDVGTLVIGDDSAHGRLMAAASNNLLQEDEYSSNPFYKYSSSEVIKAYLETGTPTQGSITVLILYN